MSIVHILICVLIVLQIDRELQNIFISTWEYINDKTSQSVV
jgi:hypothetical protein